MDAEKLIQGARNEVELEAAKEITEDLKGLYRKRKNGIRLLANIDKEIELKEAEIKEGLSL